MRYGAMMLLGSHLLVAFALTAHPAKAQVPSTTQIESVDAVIPKLGVPIPGLQFDETLRVQDEEIRIPFFSQYISAVYQYAIGIAVVAAAIMIVYGGFLYIVGSRSGSISQAKSIITDAIVGLLLVLGTYTILYTVNPETLQLTPLDVPIVKRGEPVVFERADTVSAPAGTQISAQAFCTNIEECRRFCSDFDCRATSDGRGGYPRHVCDFSKMPKAPPGVTETLSFAPLKPYPSDRKRGDLNAPGFTGGGYASAATIEGMEKAGKIAAGRGYTIVLKEALRPVQSQITSICGLIVRGEAYERDGKDGIARQLLSMPGRIVAWPGKSNHGLGNAVDIELWKDGKQLVKAGCPQAKDETSKAQSALLDQIMTEAGAKRYDAEVWHYEFNGPATARCSYPNCPWPPSC